MELGEPGEPQIFNVHAHVYFSSRANGREGLLPDCKVSVKESESEDDSS